MTCDIFGLEINVPFQHKHRIYWGQVFGWYRGNN